MVDTRTKTAERHTVTLDAETVRLWGELRSERELHGPYVFNVGKDPANPDRIGWWWRRAREAAGIDKQAGQVVRRRSTDPEDPLPPRPESPL